MRSSHSFEPYHGTVPRLTATLLVVVLSACSDLVPTTHQVRHRCGHRSRSRGAGLRVWTRLGDE